MQQFAWTDRDTAAHAMLQLVKHGPETVALGALQALQAIRSSESISTLKAIVLDIKWSFVVREAAINALAAFPEDLYVPELEPLLNSYWDERWKTVTAIKRNTMSSLIDSQLRPELNFYGAVLSFVGAHPSNKSWLFETLTPLDPTTQIELLRNAIGATCQTPLEPVFMDLLIGVLTEHPRLFTLDIAEEIANHGNDKSEQWLVQQANRIVTLGESANKDDVSAVLGFSPSLMTAVIEINPELAELDRFDINRQPQNVVASAHWGADYDYKSTPIGRQIQQLYTLAASGDDRAFTNLCVLADDYRISLSVKAVITHFIGKLWPREGVLEWLCLLLRDSDVWDDISKYMPVRLEAAEALRNTETAAAWEALIDVVSSTSRLYASPYIDWLTDLTDILSGVPSTRKVGSFDIWVPGTFRRLTDTEPSTRRDWTWTVEDRPWFQRLGDMTDDLEAILEDQ